MSFNILAYYIKSNLICQVILKIFFTFLLTSMKINKHKNKICYIICFIYKIFFISLSPTNILYHKHLISSSTLFDKIKLFLCSMSVLT